jgi:hypothetical protein
MGHEQARWCQKPKEFPLRCLWEEGVEIMKVLRMTIAVAGLLLAGPLFAQQGVQADVPFSFYVGNSKLMPPGTYRIAPCSAHAIQIRHCKLGVSVFHLMMPTDKQTKEEGKLVFHKYGDTYFLSEVEDPALSNGLVLPVSKSEKKVKAEKATVTTYQTITIPKEEEPNPPEQ